MLTLQNGVTEKKRKAKVDEENKQGQQGMRDGEHNVFASLDGHVQGVTMGQHVHTLLAKDSDRTLLLATSITFFLSSCPLFDRIYFFSDDAAFSIPPICVNPDLTAEDPGSFALAASPDLFGVGTVSCCRRFLTHRYRPNNANWACYSDQPNLDSSSTADR